MLVHKIGHVHIHVHTDDDAEWDPRKHPRGKPKNAGQFSSTPGGSTPAAKRVPKRAPAAKPVPKGAPVAKLMPKGAPAAKPAPKRAPKAEPASGNYVSFVSPNVSEHLDFNQARSGLSSERQKRLTEFTARIYRDLGVRTEGTANAIGAWADGAENSIISRSASADPQIERAAAAMAGSLADQKAVLLFHPDPKGPDYLASFPASGELIDIHKKLLNSGVPFHTLEPARGGAKVHVFGSDQETLDAAAKAAADYGVKLRVTAGQGEFIGTKLETGSDAEQRADARRAYAEVMDDAGRSSGRDIAGLWRNYDDRWRAANEENAARGAQGVTAPGEEDRISTRVPTAVGEGGSAHYTAENIVGLESSRVAEKAFAKNAELIKKYPGIRIDPNATPEETSNEFIEQVKNNITYLYDSMPDDIRQRSKLWYEGAYQIAHAWARDYNCPARSVAAVMAALSPQKDWYQNVDLARRVLTITRDQKNTVTTAKMQQYALGYITGLESTGNAKDVKKALVLRKILSSIENKKMRDITNDYEKAVWLRWYDEAHNDRNFRSVTPEGDFGNAIMSGKGEDSRVAWAGFGPIAKAISVLRDSSVANISSEMGENHKIRNFYNNIISPNAPQGDVTIDTHAVAAGLMRPLSGDTFEVKHGLGVAGAKHAGTGSKGIYGLYAEAYRQAAAEKHVEPREMQSITWEAVRGLFSAKDKRNSSIQKNVEGIWNDYQKGGITQREAQQRVTATAGGIAPPEWWRSGAGLHAAA